MTQKKMKNCYKCKIDKPSTKEFFHLDNTRSDGFCYRCKECSKGTIDKRKNRWKMTMTDEQKVLKQVSTHNYRKTEKGKSIDIISSYKQFDVKKKFEHDLTQSFVISSLKLPCIYCGDVSPGLDRKDNSKGHTIDNCVPCCKECNVSRMDNFTYDEMVILGKTIRKIKEDRKPSK